MQSCGVAPLRRLSPQTKFHTGKIQRWVIGWLRDAVLSSELQFCPMARLWTCWCPHSFSLHCFKFWEWRRCREIVTLTNILPGNLFLRHLWGLLQNIKQGGPAQGGTDVIMYASLDELITSPTCLCWLVLLYSCNFEVGVCMQKHGISLIDFSNLFYDLSLSTVSKPEVKS